jgi:hypothetical protein
MLRTGSYALLLATSIALSLLLDPMTSRVAASPADGAWSLLETHGSAPSARREYAAVYDIQRQRYVIFGGFGFQAPHPSGLFNEVWSMTLGDHNHWVHWDVAGDPPGERHSPQWGYDPARQRLLVFGGYGYHDAGSGELEYLNDVWELSLDGTPTWTELHPTGTPPSGRLAGASVYDPLRQRFVGFGGTRGLPVDTYELDLSGEPTWRTVPTTGPTPRAGYGMATIFDPVRDRMLIFGGSTSDDYWGVHNDVWELSLLDATPAWHQIELDSLSAPSPRRTLAAIHDPLRDRMVIFGGWDSGPGVSAFLNDAWALSLSPAPHWDPLQPSSALPVGRDAISAI